MKVKEILEYYEHYVDMLLEAINYNQMFSPTLVKYVSNTKVNNSVIKETIAKAKRILKREDRIVWFLRLYKMKMIGEALGTNKTPEFKTYADKELKKYNQKSGTNATYGGLKRLPSLGRLLVKLEHFYGIDVYNIDTYTLKYQTPDEVVTQFEQWEQEHIAKNSGDRFIVERNEEVFLNCGGGWVWYDLKRPYCKEEGDAMGHCGNDGVSDPNVTILSLRKKVQKDKKVFQQPHATAIYDKSSGLLEQIKGAGNEKPDTSLSPQIFKLFMDDRIKGFDKGSYKPEEDFRPDDLPEDMQKKLREVKPDMVSEEEDFFGTVREYGLAEYDLYKMQEESGMRYDEDYGFEFEWFDNFNDFAEKYGDEVTKIVGEYHHDIDGDWLYNDIFKKHTTYDELEKTFERVLGDGLEEELDERYRTDEGKESYLKIIKRIDANLYEDVYSELRRSVRDAILADMISSVKFDMTYLHTPGQNEFSIECNFDGNFESNEISVFVSENIFKTVLNNNTDITEGDEYELQAAIQQYIANLNPTTTIKEPVNGWLNERMVRDAWHQSDGEHYIKEFLKNES